MCCTSLPRVPSVLVRALKFWAVQNFLPRPTSFRSFPTSCHVHNATVARLQREQHRLFYVRPLFDVFWPWLSRKVAVWPGLNGNVYVYVTFGVYIWVWRAYWWLFCFGCCLERVTCGSHDNTCRMSGSAGIAIWRARLFGAHFRVGAWSRQTYELYWDEISCIVKVDWVYISVLHNGKPIGYRS